MSWNFEPDTRSLLSSIMLSCHRTAQEKGFWDQQPEASFEQLVSMKLLLAMTELAEATEVLRNGWAESDGSEVVNPKTDLPHLREEIADAIIRLFDLMVFVGQQAPEEAPACVNVVIDKMNFNRSRRTKHGKQF